MQGLLSSCGRAKGLYVFFTYVVFRAARLGSVGRVSAASASFFVFAKPKELAGPKACDWRAGSGFPGLSEEFSES